jgi:hypothetical protein
MIEYEPGRSYTLIPAESPRKLIWQVFPATDTPAGHYFHLVVIHDGGQITKSSRAVVRSRVLPFFAAWGFPVPEGEWRSSPCEPRELAEFTNDPTGALLPMR